MGTIILTVEGYLAGFELENEYPLAEQHHHVDTLTQTRNGVLEHHPALLVVIGLQSVLQKPNLVNPRELLRRHRVVLIVPRERTENLIFALTKISIDGVLIYVS